MPIDVTYDDLGSGLSKDDLEDVFHKLDLLRAGNLNVGSEKEPATAPRTLSGEVEIWQREQAAREEDMIMWEREQELWNLEQYEHENDLDR